jgi:hypothetical protein
VTAPDLIGLFVEPLERIEVPYMITGAVAAIIYGDPRFTRDIDLVLALDREGSARLQSVFGGGDFYVPPPGALDAELTRTEGGHFNVIHRETALRADVYLAGDDPLHAWAFDRRRRIDLEALQIWVAPMEYVIVRKLQYYLLSDSDRHLRDIAMMLRISGDMLDRDALGGWLSRLELTEVFARAERYTQ